MRIPSVIVIDVGNTSTSVSIERAGRFLLTKHFPSFLSREATIRIIRRLLKAYTSRFKIDGAILCSVVPALARVWMAELKENAGGRILQVNHKLSLGIKIDYPCPATLGADRLANAVAAADKYGAPVIVADFGTGLTFDVVSAAGAYVGGVIAPGPVLFADYLAEKTALLPRLSLATIRKAMMMKGNPPVIGKNTNMAMTVGLRLGYVGMVKEIISRLKQEKGLKNARLCATGGYSAFVLSGSGLKFTIDLLLTLRGIARIYWLNR